MKKDNSKPWKHWHFAYQNFGGQADELWEYGHLLG